MSPVKGSFNPQQGRDPYVENCCSRHTSFLDCCAAQGCLNANSEVATCGEGGSGPGRCKGPTLSPQGHAMQVFTRIDQAEANVEV